MDQPLRSGVVAVRAPMPNGIMRDYEIRFQEVHGGEWWVVGAHEIGYETTPIPGLSAVVGSMGEVAHQVERFAKTILGAHFDAVAEGRKWAFGGQKVGQGRTEATASTYEVVPDTNIYEATLPKSIPATTDLPEIHVHPDSWEVE